MDQQQISRISRISRNHAAKSERAAVTCTIGAVVLAVAVAGLTAQKAPSPQAGAGAPSAPPPKVVLTQADFTYIGSFRAPESLGGMDHAYTHGLAHRYVSGQLRMLAYGGAPHHLYEMTPPADLSKDMKSLPQARFLRKWGDIVIGAPKEGSQHLHWDEQDKRLYWAGGNPYNTTDNHAPSIGYTTLDDSTGTFESRGPWKFGSRSTKMTNTGVTSIPQWFVDAYCPGKRLAAGFGGYQSIATIGPVSMGPALTAFDPADLTNAKANSSIKFVSLVAYPFHQGGPYDNPQRARRSTDYTNELDRWDPRKGVGYWSWTDGNTMPAVWIDTPNKSGVVFFALIGRGRTFYAGSAVRAQGHKHTWFVMAPADLAKVAQKKAKEWEIQPSSWWDVEYPGWTYPFPEAPDGQVRDIVGATYDASTRTLYLLARVALIDLKLGEYGVVHAYRVAE